jgi:hypothetical protein
MIKVGHRHGRHAPRLGIFAPYGEVRLNMTKRLTLWTPT